MNKELFHEYLKRANLSKKEFSNIVNISSGSVINWGTSKRDIPYWVESWLKLYIENQELKDLKSMIKDVCKKTEDKPPTKPTK